MNMYHLYGQSILRVGLGILFLSAGILKLVFPGISGITQMLQGLGFFAPAFFAWVLILVEIVAGAGLVFGYKYKMSSILLGIVMLVAIFSLQLKTFEQDFPAQMQFFKDIGILVGLTSIYLSGPGNYCIDRRKKAAKSA